MPRQDPILDIVVGGQTRQFGRDELLVRPDVAEVAVARDVAYGEPMSYRAVPLAALLVGLNPPADSVIESVARDGFAAQLPFDLLTNADPAKAVAWLAIEPADMPWPPLPGKAASAGPFYIVWTGATRVRSEQWPYQLARLASQPSPTARWPELNVDPALPATDPSRAGLVHVGRVAVIDPVRIQARPIRANPQVLLQREGPPFRRCLSYPSTTATVQKRRKLLLLDLTPGFQRF